MPKTTIGIPCPACGTIARVRITKAADNAVRRWRQCPNCRKAFWTEETIEMDKQVWSLMALAADDKVAELRAGCFAIPSFIEGDFRPLDEAREFVWSLAGLHGAPPKTPVYDFARLDGTVLHAAPVTLIYPQYRRGLQSEAFFVEMAKDDELLRLARIYAVRIEKPRTIDAAI